MMIIVLSQPGAHANLLFNLDAFEFYIHSGEQLQIFTVTIPAHIIFSRFVEIKGSAAIQAFHLDRGTLKVQFCSFAGRAFRQVPPVKLDRLFTFLRKGTDQQINSYDPL
jgi:hypothetical protein